MKIKITNANFNLDKTICVDCGKKLTETEYRDGRDKCLSCRLHGYNKQVRKYIELDGSNDIDEILINRRKVR